PGGQFGTQPEVPAAAPPMAPPMAPLMAPVAMAPAGPPLSAVPGLAAPSLGALLAPAGGLPGGLPGGAPTGTPDALMQGLTLAGKGMGAGADQKPIMSGGVARAQMAPELKVQGGQSAISQDMILKLLL